MSIAVILSAVFFTTVGMRSPLFDSEALRQFTRELIAFALLVMATSYCLSWSIGREKFHRPISYVFLGSLVAVVAFSLHRMGSLSNAMVVAFPLLVLVTRIVFDFPRALFTYILTQVLYVSMVTLEYYGVILGPIIYSHYPADLVYQPLFAVPYVAVVAVFTHVSFISSNFLMYYIEDKESQLRDRNTELTRAYRDLEETKDRLARAEGLASLGELVAGAAHELNNPIAASYSLTQGLLEDFERLRPEALPAEREEIIEDLRVCLAQQERARNIVLRLFQLSDQTLTRTEAVDLNALVRDAVARAGGKKSGEVGLDLSPELGTIKGNGHLLQRLVKNLLDNALRAVGGEAGRVRVATRLEGKRQVLEVTDEGPGVPEEHLGEVFRPFFTTRRDERALGLGLYVCHEVATSHGGTIELANRPEGGVRAVVKLSIEDPPGDDDDRE